ncbi:hypothetical protein [Vibrio vulnificus]|uniref:hypothetical protein n=1 Tax=Vibrio vulnificus TaxID=672 RepID=UPI0029327668|nr:hypothetical protein [Vibrio vulnificus]EIA1304899.1 hypothetical protein [Vibrio vulnificus]ELP6989833.1 hypothetical protein [Vibrio vulnificus]EME0812745.1 hypothetical protein [Vibrio vulnificus]
MNKSIIFGSLVIGACVVASPFIYDSVKTTKREEQREKIAVQIEITDVTALENAANLYKKSKGKCPSKASEMVGVTIKREPKDRLGLEYETAGDCQFKSFKGITSSSL